MLTTGKYGLGKVLGVYYKKETLKTKLVFHFCDSHLEVSLISMNMYQLELMPESYKLTNLDGELTHSLLPN